MLYRGRPDQRVNWISISSAPSWFTPLDVSAGITDISRKDNSSRAAVTRYIPITRLRRRKIFHHR